MLERVLVALVVRGSFEEGGCRKVVVDYTMAEVVGYMMAEVVGYMMAGDVECRTSEVDGYNLYKWYKYVNNVV